jgi:hypothetical protein
LTGSSLEVLTTWEWPTSYGWVIPFPSDFDPKAETANDVSRVVKAAQDAAPGIALHTRIVEASHGADLLVVGSKGYGEFAGVEGRFK